MLNINASFLQKIPRGVAALFFTQIFSTFGYAVLFATLEIYISKNLGFSDGYTTKLVGVFITYNYALHLLGGYFGGRFFSYRALFCFGMLSQVIGCIFLSMPGNSSLFTGLTLFLIGAGLNVTCINCMLTQLFSPDDVTREYAFLWNYSGMNLGFVVGFLISGIYQISQKYHQLFLLTSIGNIIALIIIIMNWHKFKDIHTILSISSVKQQIARYLAGFFMLIILAFFIREILMLATVGDEIVLLLGAFMAVVILYISFTYDETIYRNKMFAYCIFAIAALIFYTIFQLMPMALTLFIERNVNRHIGNIVVPPAWFLNVDSFIVMLGGPLFSLLFATLRKRDIKISIPFLFSISLAMMGLSMYMLSIGIYTANAQGFISAFWVILCFVIYACAELCLSPIGYAMIGKLVPDAMKGLFMGTWLMLIGLAATFSSYFSERALSTMHHAVQPLLTNVVYNKLFFQLGTASIIFGIILFFSRNYILNLMYENEC